MMAFELETITALIIPFVIGLLIGYILKHTFKILAAIVVLILILIFAGYIEVSILTGIFSTILNYGERAAEAARTVGAVLPLSSIAFLLGVAIGFFLSK